MSRTMQHMDGREAERLVRRRLIALDYQQAWDEAMGSGSGSAMSTVTPNPQVQNGAHDSTVSDITQLANVFGQWGATIAGVVNNTPVSVQPGGVRTGVRGSAPLTMSGSNGILLLIIGAVVVIILFKKG